MSVKYSSRPAWRSEWVLITFIVLWGLLTIPALFAATPGSGEGNITGIFLAVWVVALVVLLYRHYSWIYRITDDQIESQHGIIARDMKTVRLVDLRNVNVKQSFFQRIFGIGDVEFSSAGGSGIEVAFFGIIKPMDLHTMVKNLRE